jgi:hypothetical protein
LLAFGYAGVDDLLDDRLPDATCDFVLLTVVAEFVRRVRFAAVLVRGDLGRGEGRGRLLVVVFFRPVGAAACASVCYCKAAASQTHPAGRDILAICMCCSVKVVVIYTVRSGGRWGNYCAVVRFARRQDFALVRLISPPSQLQSSLQPMDQYKESDTIPTYYR